MVGVIVVMVVVLVILGVAASRGPDPVWRDRDGAWWHVTKDPNVTAGPFPGWEEAEAALGAYCEHYEWSP